MNLDKRACVRALTLRLEREIATAMRAAHDAAEGATHEENRAEGSKDTRATEASYLARGQAERVRVLERSLAMLAAMELREFAPGDAIAASALVQLQARAGEQAVYLVVPAGGGLRTDVDGQIVQTLTTASPLGSALLGLAEGDEAEVQTPYGLKTFVVSRVV